MNSRNRNPHALIAPESTTTLIGEDLVRQVVEGSRKSPRGRIVLPLHKNDSAILHRMLNGIQPDSYVQPHRHADPPKPESVIVLQGAIRCYIFTDQGKIEEINTIRALSPVFGIDSEAGVYHTFLATEKDTVLFEVKPGPYSPATDKDFATWAPKEGHAEAQRYMRWLYSL